MKGAWPGLAEGDFDLDVGVCLQANSRFRTNIRLQAGSRETAIFESQNAAVKEPLNNSLRTQRLLESCSPKQRNPPACQPGGFRTSLNQIVGQQWQRAVFWYIAG